MMIVANVCVFLGPVSERWLRPRNVKAYLKIAQELGSGAVLFYFSACESYHYFLRSFILHTGNGKPIAFLRHAT
ncbi:hypothetical protein BH18ACI4_BH18ACI4_27940 [soil metagenome]